MLTPRATFKTSSFARGWQDLVDSNQFEAAASAALLELTLRFRNSPDLATSAAYQKKLEGAVMFLETLMSLTSPEPSPRTPMQGENLEHRI